MLHSQASARPPQPQLQPHSIPAAPLEAKYLAQKNHTVRGQFCAERSFYLKVGRAVGPALCILKHLFGWWRFHKWVLLGETPRITLKTEEGYCLNNQRKGKNRCLNASQKSLTAISVTCVFLFVAFSPLLMFGLYTHTQKRGLPAC